MRRLEVTLPQYKILVELDLEGLSQGKPTVIIIFIKKQVYEKFYIIMNKLVLGCNLIHTSIPTHVIVKINNRTECNTAQS